MLADRVSAALARRSETRYSADTWLSDYLFPAMDQFGFGGGQYPFGLNLSQAGVQIHEISQTLPGYSAALRSCPPAFAAQLVRALVISQARFTFRNRPSARTPRRTFGTSALAPLEQPWPNATTGELLSRMEWHAGLAGNAFVTNRTRGRLRVLRPDWVVIVYGSQQEPEQAAYALDGEVIGYVYAIGGLSAAGGMLAPLAGGRMYTLLPDEVAHWSPIPDPEASGIGMSWITPAVRDMQSDRAATDHKIRFWANGATPNLVVKGLTATTKTQFDEMVEMMEARHTGLANAYRTLYLTAGADATVVGSNFKDMDLKNVQGASETRISSLSRVPASLLGIAEGLAGSSLNAGNFGMARRIFADTWVYPTLQDLAAGLSPMVRVPSDAELWFDTHDMPLLREDGKDAAEIMQIKATTITQYVREGFTAESAIAAVRAQDESLLVHTNLVSVQLQPPGTTPPAGGATPTEPTQGGGGEPVPFSTARSAYDERKFNPDQPRDWHGRWTLTGAVIAALKALGGTQGGVEFDDGTYFDWSAYDTKTHIYDFEVGVNRGTDDEDAVSFPLTDQDLERLYSALSVTQLRDSRRGENDPDLAALAATGEADAVTFEDGSYLDWSTRTAEGNYGFGVFDADGYGVEFDLTPAELAKLRASLALSTQSRESVRSRADVDVLLTALAEFTGETRSADFNPALHPRNPKGSPGGGRFRSLVARVLGALDVWSRGDGSDDPFKAFPDREPLRLAAKERGIPLRRGATREEIVAALKADVKAKRAGAKDAKPEAGKPVRFTLTGGSVGPKLSTQDEAHLRDIQNRGFAQAGITTTGAARQRTEQLDSLARRGLVRKSGRNYTLTDQGRAVLDGGSDSKLRDLDVGVFSENGKVSLWEVSDNGERRRRVALVDDLAGLEAWATGHGESELAGWARQERGGAEPKAPAKKAAPAKRAPAKKAPRTEDAAPETKAGDLFDSSAPREAKVKATADALGKLRTDVETENKIRAAYRDLRPDGGFVGLADLRDAIAASRTDVDAVFARLAVGDSPAVRNDGFRLIPIANAKVLTDRDRAAAFRQGGENLNALSFKDPSPRSAESDILAHLDEAALSRPELDALGERLGIDVSGVHGERAKAERIAAGLAGGKAPAKTAKPSVEDVRERLDAVSSEEDAREYLVSLGLSAAEAKTLARELRVPLYANATKRDAIEGIVKVHVRSRLSADAIRESVDTSGKALEQQNKATKVAKKAAPAAQPVDLSHLRTLDPEAARDELDLRKVDELKTLLREQGLPVSGKKRDLVDRLVESLGGGGAPARVGGGTAAPGIAALPRASGPAPTALAAAKTVNPNFGSTTSGPVYRETGKAGGRWTPEMGPLPSGAYEENCTNAVAAFEMRMRGYDVEAAPLDVLDKYGYAAGRTFGEIDQLLTDSWTLPNGKPHGRSFSGQSWRSFDEIDREVLQWPEGGRGYLFVSKHIFSVVKTDGRVRYIEPQYDATDDRDVTSLYRERFGSVASNIDGTVQEAKVVRIDDLEPTDAALQSVQAR